MVNWGLLLMSFTATLFNFSLSCAITLSYINFKRMENIMLSGLLAFVQTTLLIKTVQLCLSWYLQRVGGWGDTECAKENKGDKKSTPKELVETGPSRRRSLCILVLLGLLEDTRFRCQKISESSTENIIAMTLFLTNIKNPNYEHNKLDLQSRTLSDYAVW